MGNQTALIAFGVLVLFQVVGAVFVMRAAAARPDLTGFGRLMPMVIALLVPVVGPFVAGRATDAGLRPVLVSLVGCLVAGGLFAAGGRTAPPPPPPAEQTSAEGQPADGTEPTAAEGTEATPTETAAAPAEGAEPAPTETAPAEGAEPAPAESTPPPAAAAPAETAPVPAEQPAPANQPPATAPTAPTETAAAPPAPPMSAPVAGPAQLAGLPVRPTLGPRIVLAEADFRLPNSGNMEARFEQILSEPAAKGLGFARIQLGTALTAPPWGGSQHLYVGGRVLNYPNQVIDRFAPLAIPLNELHAGRRYVMTSLWGWFEAEVRVDEAVLGADNTLTAARINVRIR